MPLTPLAAKTTRKGQATRARLLKAAQTELQAHGSLEISNVAAAAGLSQSVLYRYFGNKSGLVEAVVNEFYDEYDREIFLAPLSPDMPWLQRETLRIEKEVDFLYDHPLGQRIASGTIHDAAASMVDSQRARAHTAMAAKNIRRGQQSGELPGSVNPELVGAAIIGALRSVLTFALSAAEPPSRKEVVATIVSLSTALLHGHTHADTGR